MTLSLSGSTRSTCVVGKLAMMGKMVMSAGGTWVSSAAARRLGMAKLGASPSKIWCFFHGKTHKKMVFLWWFHGISWGFNGIPMGFTLWDKRLHMEKQPFIKVDQFKTWSFSIAMDYWRAMDQWCFFHAGFVTGRTWICRTHKW